MTATAGAPGAGSGVLGARSLSVGVLGARSLSVGVLGARSFSVALPASSAAPAAAPAGTELSTEVSTEQRRRRRCQSAPEPVHSGSPPAVMAALRLRPLLLLMLATLTAPAGGLLTSRRGAAPSSPFRNLRVEPEQRRLSWDRVTSGPRAVCRQDGRSPVREEAPGRNRCDFRLPLSRCRVTNFFVSLGDADADAAWVLFPPPLPPAPGPGPSAPAVLGLRCRLRDVVRLTCRWGRGPGAPGGARFRMFWGDARQGRAGDRECPRYLQDEGGGGGDVTGCVVDDVTALGLLPEHVAVTVTAEGADVTPGPAHDRKWPWPCDDLNVDLDLVEDLATPTLTASCNGSEARVRWEVRSLFPRVFRYRLEVHKSSQAEPETDVAQHREPHAGAASFRVRAGLKYDVSRTSGWSRAAAVDCSPREAGAPPEVTVGSAAAAAAAGAGLVVVLGTAVLLLLCRRPLKAKLLPRIPPMKDPVGAAPGETVAWAAAPEDCPVTLVTEA